MERIYGKVVNEFCEKSAPHEAVNTAEMMKIARLDRIVDSLEAIADMKKDVHDATNALSEMATDVHDLARCVGYAPPMYDRSKGFNFLNIRGAVNTD